MNVEELKSRTPELINGLCYKDTKKDDITSSLPHSPSARLKQQKRACEYGLPIKLNCNNPFMGLVV